MARKNRCVLPGVPCHITQRGVDRRRTFDSDQDYLTYLHLLRSNLVDTHVTLLAWCLMPNHVHLIAIPQRDDSLAVLLRRVHGRYAQYYNASTERAGHLWENRFYSCLLDSHHTWHALVYVERNPLRAGLVASATLYPWSSAQAHTAGDDVHQLCDMGWWRREGPQLGWAEILNFQETMHAEAIRAATHAGRPLGESAFVEDMSLRFDRHWQVGRPRKRPGQAFAVGTPTQRSLFDVA